ncbi:hypothetical protein RUM43_014889 [Polyplax serrata]|uniref:Centrosomin N-terminal motif 1 domain-containing protein n=1 Tax=Polyplax serrata TaxID=468196 RepID=A0AAN8RZ96_POLSC
MDLSASESAVDVDDSELDSSSDIVKADYLDAANYDSHAESGSESQVDFAEIGMRNSSSGLTMKEYEEQLKKLTTENFNLKLRVYFVEERLSKVTGISDKEDLIKKNIQLKVTCESQLKELEKKQKLLFEASKAFELLQEEHAQEIKKMIAEKDKEIGDWEDKFNKLDAIYNEIKIKFPIVELINNPEAEVKTFEDYQKEINELESNLRIEQDRNKELENLLNDNQLELESYEVKSQRMESELEQRMNRVQDLVYELEQKEHALASSNFRVRKLEDDLKSKQRDDDIMKERIEEKNKTIESLKNSLASRHDIIENLENRLAKERSSSQSMQSKVNDLTFQNTRLKEEFDILQSRLRRTTEALSPRGKGRAVDEDTFKQKYEELVRVVEEQQSQNSRRIKELEEKLGEKDGEVEEYRDLLEKHKKLEDDHRKACTALKNFIKRSSDEKKEREVLNHMVSNHEEIIADLKAQLDRYRKNSISWISQDDKLSLPETGDDRYMNDGAVSGKETYLSGKEKSCMDNILADKLQKMEEEGKDVTASKEENKLKTIFELTTEIVSCNAQFEEEKAVEEMQSKPSPKQLLQIVSEELTEKNCQIEKLEKRVTELKNVNNAEITTLQKEISLRDSQLNVLQSKLQDIGAAGEADLLECKLSLGVAESLNSIVEGVTEMNVWSLDNGDAQSRSPRKSVIDMNQQEMDAESKGIVAQANAVKICTLLSLRLEELATFLDSLLKNNDLLFGVGSQRRDVIKQAMEKSRELSRHLSLSFARRDFSDTSLPSCDVTFHSIDQYETIESTLECRERVISEQSVIINRLREQLKLLNQEIKQRDIELSRCQGINGKEFIVDISDQDGIEKQMLSICQDLSDDSEVNENDCAGEPEKIQKLKTYGYSDQSQQAENCSRKILFSMGNKIRKNNDSRSNETSESDAWSEPDRSVSLARMGRLEDTGPSLPHRNFKCGDSSESSEETLNENTKTPAKRCRSADSEVRRLQSQIKMLDEANENLRLEVSLLKNQKFSSKDALKYQSEEEANLAEKLRHAMDRLDECNLTCRQLEEKLAAALERASASVVQLSKATETISSLEQQITQLKEEIEHEKADSRQKSQKINNLESKIEEVTIESQLKLIEAVKQREAAERKALEVECKLKEAENIRTEVESKMNEVEKRISETKKFKREKRVDEAEKMMDEAERIKAEAERKSRDFQSFIDLMRKEVEEKMKEAERRIKKSEKEKEEMEKQIVKLKKRLLEAEKNKAEVEAKVKEGKETIQCMEEKLKELEVAMDQCNEGAQRKIKDMQKKADARVMELEMKIEERELARKTELEKKWVEAEKISKELEIGLRKQLEDAERRIRKAKEVAEATIKKVQEDSEIEVADLKRKISDLEVEKKNELAEILGKLDEAKLEASVFELELTRLTNEKIHLEEELKRMLDKETALVRDNKEIKGKYESSIHELEEKLMRLTLNKSQLASRLEEIESTNIDLVTRISAIRGKETMIMEHEFTSSAPPAFSPPRHGSPLSTFFADVELCVPERCGEGRINFSRQGSTVSDPGEQPLGIHSMETFVPPRRNMNSSPDLGIESDPGRFSSLEANHVLPGDRIGPLGEPTIPLELKVVLKDSRGYGGFRFTETAGPVEIKKLEYENAELKRRLTRTRQALEETLTQLSAANQRKKQVERAICKQLHKTHHILKKARVNFESQDEGESLE